MRCAYAIALAAMLTALSCSSKKIEKVSISGRLLRSDGSPIAGVPVYLIGGREKENYWNYPTDEQRSRHDKKSDGSGRFAFEFHECVRQETANLKEIRYTVGWGRQLRLVTNGGKPVAFKIECDSEEINLGDLVSLNVNAAETDKFIITGTLRDTDGKPLAGKLTLQEVTRKPEGLAFSTRYDNRGLLLNPVGESDGNGVFAVHVSRDFPKDGQEYAIEWETPLPDEFGRRRVLTAILSRDKSPILLRIEGEPQELRLGEISVDTKP